MGKFINPNLRLLVNYHRDKVINAPINASTGKPEPDGGGVTLEGSSRSAKTWGSVDFIIYLCTKVEENSTINIIKETYSSFKTTLYDDFNRRLPDFGIASPFADRQEVSTFKLFGNKINLLGADSETVLHGVSSDYTYYNELLDVSKQAYDQTTMRCRKMWWADYNPKYIDHWAYNLPNDKRNAYLKTTFADNPFLSLSERNKILSYEPTHPDDRDIQDVKKRRPHPTNILNGTADEYMWNVYGLGIRSAPEGLVFQHVNWITHFPSNCEHIYFGMDFGSVDPMAIVKVGVNGMNMYVEVLYYQPTPSAGDVVKAAQKFIKDGECWADSAEPGLISDCRNNGKVRVLAVSKFAGSIGYGISVIKKFKLHLVDSPAARKEQGSYKYKMYHGIKQEDPEDANNHWWDAVRYVVLSRFRHIVEKKK